MVHVPYVFTLAVRGLRRGAWLFFSCGGRGLLSSCRAWAPRRGGLSLRSTGPGVRPSAAAACGLRSPGVHLSCSLACGIFLDPGLNLCPLHWRADSYPLYHWGSPSYNFWNFCFFWWKRESLENIVALRLIRINLKCSLDPRIFWDANLVFGILFIWKCN